MNVGLPQAPAIWQSSAQAKVKIALMTRLPLTRQSAGASISGVVEAGAVLLLQLQSYPVTVTMWHVEPTSCASSAHAHEQPASPSSATAPHASLTPRGQLTSGVVQPYWASELQA